MVSRSSATACSPTVTKVPCHYYNGGALFFFVLHDIVYKQVLSKESFATEAVRPVSDVFSVAELPPSVSQELRTQGFSPEHTIATITVEKSPQESAEDVLRATLNTPYLVPSNQGTVLLDHGFELTSDLQYWIMAGQTPDGRKVRALFSPAVDGATQITVWIPLQRSRTIMTFTG